MILHDVSSGTIAHGPYDFYVAPLYTFLIFILVLRSPVSTLRTCLNDVIQHLLLGLGTTHTSMMVYQL